MAKIALFGGSFDPIHEGHLTIAKAAREACNLDVVQFIPAFQSPFKTDRKPTPSEHRLAMCKLAIKDLSWAEVCDWEIEQGNVSYSWETATHFVENSAPDDELHWILGADQWVAIEKWSRAEHLASLVSFIAFPRKEAALNAKDGFSMQPLEATHPASSTAIREAVAAEAPVEWLNPSVAEYIQDHRLYRK